MNRMRANIATWRRSHPVVVSYPVPERTDEVRHDGFVCPTCLRFGQQQCRDHKERDPHG